MANTLTFGDVRDGFAKEGYTLLTESYINSKQKLVYRCQDGHENETTWNTFHSRGRRCPECYWNRKREQLITPIQDLRASFAVDGYTLITMAYTAGHQKLETLCTRGHAYNTSVRQWNQGYRCMKCWGIDHSGEKNANWNPDREAVIHNKKIWTAWRNLLRSGVVNKNRKTSADVSAILGYEWSDLRRHVQAHPQWEACKEDYQIDHVFPVKAFRDYGISDPKIVNALDNLRPLSKTENHRKNKFYDRIAFERYLDSKGIQWQKALTTAQISKS